VGAFADLQLGVRPAGMGGAYTALSSDANATLYNPAATVLVRYASFTATTTRIFGIVPATFLGVHYPLRAFSLSGGFQQVGDDLLRETTFAVAGAMRGDRLLPHNFLNLPYLNRMGFSVTARFRLASFGNDESGGPTRITGDGQGYALDFGYYLQLNGIRFGATLQDAIGHFRWNSSGRGNYVQNMPRRLRFGIAYAEPRLRFSVDFEPTLYNDVSDRIFAGLETSVLNWLVLRGGIAQNIGGPFENKLLTLGAGIYSVTWRQYRLGIQGNYRSSEFDNAFRFGLDLFWPGGR